MTLDTERPVAVVTGASAGIGRATARQLVEADWQVIGVGRDPAETLVWLATDLEGARDPGRHFHNKAEETPITGP